MLPHHSSDAVGRAGHHGLPRNITFQDFRHIDPSLPVSNPGLNSSYPKPEQNRTGRMRPTSMFAAGRPPPDNINARRTSFSSGVNHSIDPRLRRPPSLHSSTTFQDLRRGELSLAVSNSASNTSCPTSAENVPSRVRPSSHNPGRYPAPTLGNTNYRRSLRSIQDNYTVAPRLQRAPTLPKSASFSKRDNYNHPLPFTKSRPFTADNRSYPEHEQNIPIKNWANSVSPGPPPSINDSRRSSLSIQTNQSTTTVHPASAISGFHRRQTQGHLRTQSVPVITSDRSFPDPRRRQITSLNSSVYSRGSRQEVQQEVTQQRKQLETWDLRQKFKHLKERLESLHGNSFSTSDTIVAAFQPEMEISSLPPNSLDVYVAAPLLLGPGINPQLGYGPEGSNIATLSGEMKKLHLQPNEKHRFEAMRREFFQLNGQRVKMLGKAKERNETLVEKDLSGRLFMQEVEECEELIGAWEAWLPRPDGLRGLQWVFDVGIEMDIDPGRHVSLSLELGMER